SATPLLPRSTLFPYTTLFRSIQDALRYVSGMRGEAYGIDSRGDSALVRGTSPGVFLDGLQKGVGYYNNTRTDPFTLERIEVLKGDRKSTRLNSSHVKNSYAVF